MGDDCSGQGGQRVYFLRLWLAYQLKGESVVVGTIGFEPTTSCSQSKCSTRLSYVPLIERTLTHVGMPSKVDYLAVRFFSL